MADQRRAGLIQLQAQGVTLDAKGNFTYSVNPVKREAVIGSDGVHGFKETAQVQFIEGAITDRGTLDVKSLVTGTGLTITLSLSNGKVITLKDAWFAGEGNASTEEAEIPVRWEGSDGEEIAT